MADSQVQRRPELISAARSYRVLFRASWRASVQYRGNFASTMLGGIAFQGTQLLFIGVLLAKFGTIAGWSFNEIGFVFALRLAAHSGYVIPFGNLFHTDLIVHQGEFDRILLRPVNPFVQLITRRFPLMAFGDLLLGFGALIIFSIAAPIDWSGGKIIFLIAAIVGGSLVETGVQTFLCGLTFPMISTRSLRSLVDDTFTKFSGYPLTMFGRWGFWSLTFVFPMAFIAFLPATVLLDRTEGLPLPAWLPYASPAAGVIIFALGYTFFMRMTRFYTSPGN